MAEKKNLLVLDTMTRRLASIVNHLGASSQSDHPSLSQNDSYERVHGDVPSHDFVWRVIASDADSDKEFTDIIYEKAVREGIAKISINKPERMNAFRPNIVKELIRAFNDSRHDSSIGVVILTGKGTKAFCSGGDQALRTADGYSDNEDIGSLNVLDLQNHPAVVVPRLPAGLNLPSPVRRCQV
ncbi:1,4-dihydroxy-2-naphthoyl-CoA synthase, peroxisomal-like [Arachis ipaensis]|uniref:1,4-dihydroxy-2-naphthoyl-CoA synthase, peroxisomal-like n=1 Tax=Arachis ipaensis TaxID=130454 RepID=UPI000A2B5509|nr:1,4-dihydroxy-2-naphthoyl-CoA synthase, peroxisomal-like [Arachis ipaensis]